MKNATVKELIELLETFDQDAIVCRIEPDDNDVPFYSTVEMVKSIGLSHYIDDAGDEVNGKIIGIY